MAEKYAQLFVDSAAKMYADTSTTGATITPMAVRAFAAALSTKASWLPGPGGTKGSFVIQRRKRIKRKQADTSANLGDQVVARLNNASKPEWDSIDVLTGTRFDFLVSEEIGDAENFSTNPEEYKDGIEQSITNAIISSEEDALDEIIADGNVRKISLGSFSSSQMADFGEKLFEALALSSTNIKQLVDDYKHFSPVGLHVSNYASQALREYKGTIFTVDSSKYADDIIPNFTTNNADFGLVNSHFDKFTIDQSSNGGAKDEKIVAIIMDSDSYFDSGYANNLAPLDTKLLDINFKGHSYYGAKKVIDASRIIVLTAGTATDKVAKAND